MILEDARESLGTNIDFHPTRECELVGSVDESALLSANVVKRGSASTQDESVLAIYGGEVLYVLRCVK